MTVQRLLSMTYDQHSDFRAAAARDIARYTCMLGLPGVDSTTGSNSGTRHSNLRDRSRTLSTKITLPSLLPLAATFSYACRPPNIRTSVSPFPPSTPLLQTISVPGTQSNRLSFTRQKISAVVLPSIVLLHSPLNGLWNYMIKSNVVTNNVPTFFLTPSTTLH